MELNYWVADPTKNVTILVETCVPVNDQSRIAALLMEREPSAEQVGFIRRLDGECGISLRMAGGEFCGNAAMSAAALYAASRGLDAYCGAHILVRVSGAERPVPVEIQALPDGSFSGTVDMPTPLSVAIRELSLRGRDYALPVVELPGITHVIVEGGMERSDAEEAVKEWCACLGAGALGLMLLDGKRLRPLVYVPAAGTLFWESSCASGTSAVGAWVSTKDGAPRRLTLSEPGGIMNIEADMSAALPCLRLGGNIRICGSGTLDVRN